MVQEWQDEVRKNPFLRSDEEQDQSSPDTVLTAAEASDSEALNIGAGGNAMQLPLWALITGIIVVFLLLVALLGMVTWCIRKRRHFGKDPVSSASVCLPVPTGTADGFPFIRT